MIILLFVMRFPYVCLIDCFTCGDGGVYMLAFWYWVWISLTCLGFDWCDLGLLWIFVAFCLTCGVLRLLYKVCLLRVWLLVGFGFACLMGGLFAFGSECSCSYLDC